MEPHDLNALQDMLRSLDGERIQGTIRQMLPSGLALLLGHWSSAAGKQQTLWADAPSEEEARILAGDFRAILPGVSVAYFPSMAAYAGGESSPTGLVLKDRLSTLIGLLERRVQILVTGPLAAQEILPHPTWFEKRRLIIAKGAELPRGLLLETLVELGYRHVELASQPGEFSARGLVIDIWPDHLDNPLRLECFGDELERIAPFDPDTQRRMSETIDSVSLYPRFEGQRTPESLNKALDKMSVLTEDPENDLAFRKARLVTHGSFPGEELFYSMLEHPKGQLLHWVPPCLRVRLEPSWADSIFESERRRIEDGLARLRSGGVVCPNFEDRFNCSDGSRATLHLAEWQSEASAPLQAQPVREFQGRLGELAEYLQQMALTGHRIFLAGSTTGMRDRLREILRDHELPLSIGIEAGCRAMTLNLSGGIYLKSQKMLVLTEREVFGRRAIQPTKPQKSRLSAFLSDLRDLRPGDRVVHLDHGIGEFLGFGILTVGGEEQDVIQLRYADGGMVNVSLERADLLQRYVSSDNALPPLDKLGGASWAKVKRRAKKAIRDMAEELLKLYAKRKLEKGFAFSVDGPEMAEFEAGFPYEPTPDQTEASEAIKADLESPKPMDRLVCGDVGFGKTEVAMRAAAKAALSGKQVAVLCPTTVLCFQHFRTFQDRFAGFPIRIEMLNRFVDPSKVKQIQRDIADGKVEIVIGTHQLLGARITFSDLGLVVIDEEQRFGVLHKEKLKKLRANVDVLAMSATPIPRTLHMSLTGLREISLIETPPKNRLAIETVVAPWSDELVASAIQFELRRNGQVYVIHNRVDSIVSIAERIRELVPDARVGVGHAQLSDDALEQVMLNFMEGRIDVLIATTIVENGLDVPNANTLIVHRADMFGLSQLYQLRGRVGRSDIPAYAYLLIPGKGQITEDARKRLQALEDFSELGSGFRIAALDLELRGAGNLLGGEQSGHINEIGFELYIKLLEETLQELKGEPSGTFEVKLDLGPARISKQWLDKSSERAVAYKRVSHIRSERDLELYRLELEDRFGPIPQKDEESKRFFQAMQVKLQAQRLAINEIVSIHKTQGTRQKHETSSSFDSHTSKPKSAIGAAIKFKLSPQTPIDPSKLMAWVQHRKNTVFSPDGYLTLSVDNMDSAMLTAIAILREWESSLL